MDFKTLEYTPILCEPHEVDPKNWQKLENGYWKWIGKGPAPSGFTELRDLSDLSMMSIDELDGTEYRIFKTQRLRDDCKGYEEVMAILLPADVNNIIRYYTDADNWQEQPNGNWKWVGYSGNPLHIQEVVAFRGEAVPALTQLHAKEPQLYMSSRYLPVGSHIENHSYHTGGESYGDQEIVDDYATVSVMILVTPEEVSCHCRRKWDEQMRGADSRTLEERIKIGEALGYSQFKIWSIINPVKTAVAELAALGMASGLGYMLYQYFSK